MLNPSKPHIDPDHPRTVRLPASFAPGDRVVIETNAGDVYSPLEVASDDEGPLVELPVRPDAGATRVFVRPAPERRAA
jgi:hypothetical protein